MGDLLPKTTEDVYMELSALPWHLHERSHAGLWHYDDQGCHTSTPVKVVLVVQVMPFVLRRTKDQVLKDLPPKIIQDVYVEPSALQRQLYEDFSATPASQQAAGAVSGDISAVSAASKAPHVFQVSAKKRLPRNTQDSIVHNASQT